MNLDALLMNDNGAWVMQCLQYDIAAQSELFEGVELALKMALAAQIDANVQFGKKPFQDVPRAPEKYWALFEKSAKWEFRNGLLFKYVYWASNIDFVECYITVRMASLLRRGLNG